MSGSTLYGMKNKAPRPMWPWLLGGAAAIGGFTWMRKKDVNVLHRQSSILHPKKTRLDVVDKKE